MDAVAACWAHRDRIEREVRSEVAAFVYALGDRGLTSEYADLADDIRNGCTEASAGVQSHDRRGT